VITNPNGQTLTQLQTQYPFFAGISMSNTCISIQGHLLIDKNFTITGGEIIMAPGAEITVLGNMTFTLQDVNQNGGMHGCTAMWKGIRALSTSSSLIYINIENSTIQDARHAVLTHKRTRLKSENSDFINNWFGILVPRLPNNIPPFPHNDTKLALSGNLFSTHGQLLPLYWGFMSDSYPVIANYVSKYQQIGIFTDNASGLLIGSGNTSSEANIFERLYIGVFSANTNIRITNNIFQKIGPMHMNTYYDSYHGIHTENGNTRETTVDNNLFEECQLGVFAHNTHLVTHINRFQDCVYGCVVRTPTNKDVTIHNNNISSNIGISVLGDANASSLNISGNTITFPAFPNALGFTGIEVGGTTTLFSADLGFLITNNTINSNYLSQLPPPYWLLSIVTSATRNLEILENTMNLQWGTGIFLSASNGTRIIDNKVYQTGYYVNAATIANSPNTTISCNRFEGHNDGLIISGVSDCDYDTNGQPLCTTIRANLLKNPGGNTLVLLNAIISPQWWKGNQWEDVDAPGSSAIDIEAQYIGDLNLIDMSKIITHTDQLPFHPQHILINGNQQINPEIWIKSISNSNHDQCDIPPLTGGNGQSVELLNILETYAQGSLEQYGYGKGARWIADRHLYRNLKTAPTLAASSPILQQFYTAAQTNAIGKLHEVEQGLQSLHVIPEAVQMELEELYEEEKELSKALEDLLALPDPVNTRDLAALETARTEAVDALYLTTSEIQNIQATLETARLNKLQQLQAFNSGIVTTEVPSQYVKTVYAIALTHAADYSELTPAERSQLEAIAVLCPSEGGDAVYSARALLGRLQYDDCNESPELNLQQALPQVYTTAPVEAWGIFPNPGHDDFSILTPATPSGRVELKIYDITGHIVFRSMLPAGERSALQLPLLRGGLYLYEVSDAGQRLLIGKLSKLD